MAIQQIARVYIDVRGDGTASSFVYALANLYQNAGIGSIPFGSTGVVPTSVEAVSSPVGVNSASIDVNGNITVTFASFLATGAIQTVELRLIYASGLANSTSPIQSAAVQGVNGGVAMPVSSTFGNMFATVSNYGASSTSFASWTSATANNAQALLINASLVFSTLVVTLDQAPTGTLTAGGCFFEVSNDNSKWVTISGAPSAGGLLSALTFAAATYSSLTFNIAGWQYFRVRLNPVITGTGTVTIGYAAQSQSNNVLISRDAKDSGRTPVVLYVDTIAGVTTEALVTMNRNDGGTVSTGTSYTVTPGKIFRIQSVFLSVRGSSATLVNARARIRSAATVASSSPIFAALEASTNVATSGAANPANMNFPDGLEIAGGQQVGISQIASATSALVTVCVVGYEY